MLQLILFLCSLFLCNATLTTCNSEADLDEFDCTVEKLPIPALLEILDRRGYDGQGLDFEDLVEEVELILDFEKGLYHHSTSNDVNQIGTQAIQDIALNSEQVFSEFQSDFQYPEQALSKQADKDEMDEDIYSDSAQIFEQNENFHAKKAKNQNEDTDEYMLNVPINEADTSDIDFEDAAEIKEQLIQIGKDGQNISGNTENQEVDSIGSMQDLGGVIDEEEVQEDTESGDSQNTHIKQEKLESMNENEDGHSEQKKNILSNILGYFIELGSEVKNQMCNDFATVIEFLPKEILNPLKSGVDLVSRNVKQISNPVLEQMKRHGSFVLRSGKTSSRSVGNVIREKVIPKSVNFCKILKSRIKSVFTKKDNDTEEST